MSKENFDKTIAELEQAHLNFEQKLTLYLEVQLQYMNAVAVHGNQDESRRLYNVLHGLLDQLKKQAKTEQKYVELVRSLL